MAGDAARFEREFVRNPLLLERILRGFPPTAAGARDPMLAGECRTSRRESDCTRCRVRRILAR